MAIAQQSVLEKKISLSYSQVPLHIVLSDIEKQGGFNFSFNSQLFNKNEIVSVSATDLSIIEILRDLISDKTLVYREHANQIIIYKPRKGDLRGKPIHIPVTIDKEKEELKTVYDTIYEYILVSDTIKKIVRDTIVEYKKEIVYDTIKVQNATSNNIDKDKNRSVNYSASAFISNISYSNTKNLEIGNINNMNKSNDVPMAFAFNASVVLGSTVKTKTGIGIFVEREPQDINIKHVTSEYKSTTYDTTYSIRWAGTYFEYLNGDTIKHDVYDSIMNITQKDDYDSITNNVTIKGTNTIVYVSVPLITYFPIYGNESIGFGLNTGIFFRIPIVANGELFNATDYSVQKLQQDMLKLIHVDFYCAPVFSYKIKNDLHITAETSFLLGINSTYKDEIIYIRNASHFGLSLGIVKKI